MIDHYQTVSPKKMTREELEIHLRIFNGNITKLKPGGTRKALTPITGNRGPRKMIGEETKVSFPAFVRRGSK